MKYYLSYYFLFYLHYAFLGSLVPYNQKIIAATSYSTKHYYNDTVLPSIKRAHKDHYDPHRMKILFIVGHFPVLSEKAILNQIVGLIKRNHDVYIYAKKRGETPKVHTDIERYNLLERTFYKELPPDLNEFDIIFCQFGMRGEKFALIKQQKKLKCKLVTCFRGADISKKILEDPHMYDQLFKVGDLFMPVCKFFKDKLKQLGCPSKKIVVLHSAIDCSQFRFKQRFPDPDDSITIISTCRLIEKKGLEYAIRAVAQVHQTHPNIQYLIVGGGKLEEELKQLIKQLNAEEYIKLVGWCTHDEVVTILDNAHLFILPSVTAVDGNQEGIANALKEAMAMGLPVISTYHSGTPELVEHKKSGFLVPERNVNALVSYLEHLINHPEIWPAMGRAGRRKVEEEFDMEKENDRLVHIFQQLLKK